MLSLESKAPSLKIFARDELAVQPARVTTKINDTESDYQKIKSTFV